MQASQQKDAFASYLTANFQAVSSFPGCGFSCFIASGCGIFELIRIFVAFLAWALKLCFLASPREELANLTSARGWLHGDPGCCVTVKG